MNISSKLVYLNKTKSNVYHVAQFMAWGQNIVLFGRYCLIGLDDYCYLRNILGLIKKIASRNNV